MSSVLLLYFIAFLAIVAFALKAVTRISDREIDLPPHMPDRADIDEPYPREWE